MRIVNVMRPNVLALAAIVMGISGGAAGAERRLNNLVSDLLDVASPAGAAGAWTFARSSEGWVFISVSCQGKGTVTATLDAGDPVVVRNAESRSRIEAMRRVNKGLHTIKVACKDGVRVDKLSVKAIPELIHCGLGFNPEIKSYGVYGMDFLKSDILSNVTTLIVPTNLKLSEAIIAQWHGEGKKFVAEVGIDSQAKTVEDHFNYWRSFYGKAPFLDGIIINEFIVNRPVAEWAELTAERLARMERERRQYEVYGEAIEKLRGDERYAGKMLYAYVGGSGKKLNQEIIGTNFIRTIQECGYRVVLERYLHEMSTEKGSQGALASFVDGIADWEAREAGVKGKMVIAFGLFSMPPGSINKQPNVDYHVWMDQQMNLVANHPVLADIAGLEWWTSVLADEETVRFVGKLYRHYALNGSTNMLTTDPLFLPHIQNGDFARGTEGWTINAAEEGAVTTRQFPRYGRIEGRFMGLGRPADPEHIGDTFLWMKRSPKGANTFSQTIKSLRPGQLYSLKMFSCDYLDLVQPKEKKLEDANQFIGTVSLDRVEIDQKRSFTEVYASTPEPKIPIWITYH